MTCDISRNNIDKDFGAINIDDILLSNFVDGNGICKVCGHSHSFRYAPRVISNLSHLCLSEDEPYF